MKNETHRNMGFFILKKYQKNIKYSFFYLDVLKMFSIFAKINKKNIMKNKYLVVVFLWILWGLGLDYISEEIINRPMNQTIQFIVTLAVLTVTVLLVRKTFNIIINNLKN